MAKHLIVVIGPTAIGKTALAIRLAQYYQCEILSADSRQFFKEMSIGTAVPSNEELEAAKHHFIHNKSIFENYTVGDFEKDAIEKLDELFKSQDCAILVGGSGLYIDAVLKGFDEFPETDPKTRTEIALKYQEFGISYLQEELQKHDPAYYTCVDTENPQRMMRALEVCKSTGKPYSSFLNHRKNPRGFTPILVGIDADRNVMYERINHRVDQMMETGLLAEATALHPFKSLNALQTVGYRELFGYLDGEYSLDFAISEIKKNTRRFAKRQMTWFRKNDKINWFDFETPLPKIISHVDTILNS